MAKTKSVTPVPTLRECFVCERSYDTLVYLGHDRYRHGECAPGTQNWCEWYDQHPDRHTDTGDILRAHNGA